MMELSLDIPCSSSSSSSTASSCHQSPTGLTSQHSVASPASGVSNRPRNGYTMQTTIPLDSFFTMDLMRKQKLLCDVVLKVGDKAIPVHRLVLASCSPYFHAMFTNEMAECFKSEVTLHDIDANAVELLVAFAYTSEIKITEETVQYLLPAASLLQLHSVRDACCRFLATQLTPSNCLGIRRFADTHGCFDLRPPPSSCPSKLQSSRRRRGVEELVSSEELVVAEEDAFLAVTKWITNDQNKRKKHTYSLMRHIRLPLTSRNFVAQCVACHPLVQASPDCKDLVIEAMKYHLLPDQRTLLQSPRTLARHHAAATPMLFAIGGGSLFAIHSDCECYNSKTQTWLPVASMNVKRARLGVAAVGSYIYAIGGYDGSNDVWVVEKFNTQTNAWLQVSSMENAIFAVGGYDGSAHYLASRIQSGDQYLDHDAGYDQSEE
ncbi:putative kelch-like protein 17 isoform X2 [Apostichopus japonicus]|uniref:Putative kelch-like protein 17 isoform X2 n=1 Tax=Stichopus japonicus TaxID=307972 RepID=A0A2G8JL35_STIJA|nr:putative kelch-like protein 17 isoform X2 [Apostichopus japonicus]